MNEPKYLNIAGNDSFIMRTNNLIFNEGVGYSFNSRGPSCLKKM